MEKLNDERALLATIKPYVGKMDRAGKPMIGAMMEELRVRYQGRERAIPTRQMLDALFAIGESIIRIETLPDMFTLAPRTQLLLTIDEFLEIWGVQAAGEHLKVAFEKCKSPTMCAEVFVARARELEKIPGDRNSNPLITSDDFNALGEKLLPLLEGAAGDGTLANAPYYMSILRAWKYLAGTANPKAWLSVGIEGSSQFLAKVSLGMLSYTISSRERWYTLDERPDSKD